MLTPGIWELTPSFGNKVEIHFSKSHVAGIRELDARVRDLIRRVRPEDRAVAPGTNVIATTGIHVPGRPILSIVDVVSAEVAMGINTFKDIATAFRDVVGGRAKSLQGVMREARQLCIQELKAEAERVGGEAVIGVDLDYTEIRSGMMLVVATGTAVTLSPVEDLPARSG
ncbi:MAG: YbjQ family protein [Mesorhizobium sp.]|nr:MAG: YbjQ family protein [Mesorhizobium sp.]